MIYKYIYTPEICNSNGYAGRKHGANKNCRKKKRIYRKFAIRRERSNSVLRRVESTNVTIYSYTEQQTHIHVYRHKYTTVYTNTRMTFE